MLENTTITISQKPTLFTIGRQNLVQNISATVVMSVAAILSLSTLFWTVREKVLPLSANSEFFAFSWVYALRWGAGEYVFQPHGQITIPIFSLIDKSLRMTEGSPDQIISGWHSIAFYWPLALMTLSLAVLFSTTNREHRLTDTIFSSVVYMASVPLFLTDFAIGSMAYHSLAIPLALASLPFWNFYRGLDRRFKIPFYVMLGVYAAVCVLGKPTFGAFAAPFFVMEFIKSIRGKHFLGISVAVSVAIIFYFGWLFLFYGSISGVASHLSRSLYFMQSQAGWYDNEKGVTPFHWYIGYVFGKMGPLPSALIVISILFAFTRKDRSILLAGIISAIGCALFCLHARSQLHAYPEFMALIATTTIAAFRCSRLPVILAENIRFQVFAPIAVATAIAMLVAKYPLSTEHRFSTTMSEYDTITVPALFQQPENTKTIALMKYPNVMWGVADAWCRGSGNIFDGNRSYFLDKKFGNITCFLNHEPISPELSRYSHAIFVKPANTTESSNLASLYETFPAISNRLRNCRSIGTVKSDGAELFRCALDN